MALSPEERRRIYEEEKARIEAESRPAGEEASSTRLAPHVAALLCYLGLWITGIVFVIIETKNRYVRFHAVQSIIVFGFLAVAGVVLQGIVYDGGWFFNQMLGALIGIITFILWIVLMVKAYHGELYKVIVAGDLAVKISGISTGEKATAAEPGQPKEQTEMAVSTPPVAVAGQPATAGTAYRKGRISRITASAFTIAWSIIWLIVLNFFSRYIAYYQLETMSGVTRWNAYPILTADYSLWLPVVNTALILSIVGHIILIAFDKYVLRETSTIILNLFGIAAVATLLSLFPFDFSQIPDASVEMVGPILTTIILLGIIIGIGIATLVSFIKLIINVATRSTSY